MKYRSDDLTKVCEAVGVDATRCQRIIIDLQAANVPRVYVQMFGSDALLKVLPPVVGMAEVQILDAREAAA